MSFILFVLGVFGIAGAIETDGNPTIAIIMAVIGFIWLMKETKDNVIEYREDSRPRFLP